MAIELSLFNNSVTTLVNHLTSYYGEEAALETYVICVRVKSANIPGGSGINWIVGPNGHERAMRRWSRGCVGSVGCCRKC